MKEEQQQPLSSLLDRQARWEEALCDRFRERIPRQTLLAFGGKQSQVFTGQQAVQCLEQCLTDADADPSWLSLLVVTATETEAVPQRTEPIQSASLDASADMPSPPVCSRIERGHVLALLRRLIHERFLLVPCSLQQRSVREETRVSGNTARTGTDYLAPSTVTVNNLDNNCGDNRDEQGGACSSSTAITMASVPARQSDATSIWSQAASDCVALPSWRPNRAQRPSRLFPFHADSHSLYRLTRDALVQQQCSSWLYDEVALWMRSQPAPKSSSEALLGDSVAVDKNDSTAIGLCGVDRVPKNVTRLAWFHTRPLTDWYRDRCVLREAVHAWLTRHLGMMDHKVRHAFLDQLQRRRLLEPVMGTAYFRFLDNPRS